VTFSVLFVDGPPVIVDADCECEAEAKAREIRCNNRRGNCPECDVDIVVSIERIG